VAEIDRKCAGKIPSPTNPAGGKPPKPEQYHINLAKYEVSGMK
jgi:hypothetical protein